MRPELLGMGYGPGPAESLGHVQTVLLMFREGKARSGTVQGSRKRERSYSIQPKGVQSEG